MKTRITGERNNKLSSFYSVLGATIGTSSLIADY